MPNVNWQSTLGFPGLVYVSVREPGTSGQFAHVQMYAKSFALDGTGWQVIVDRVTIATTQSATVRFGVSLTALASVDGIAQKLDDQITFTLQVEGRSQTSPTELSLSVVGEVYVPAFTPTVIYGPFRLGQSRGLTFNPRTQAVGIDMLAWVSHGQFRSSWP